MKEMFKHRLLAGYVMVIAWTVSSPILKTYYNLLPSVFFGIVGIWVLITGLSQKLLRKNVSIRNLMLIVIVLDAVYMSGMSILNLTHSIKHMLIFDSVIDGPYMAVLVATSAKLETYYLGRFRAKTQDNLKSIIYNKRIWANIVGLSIGTLLSFVINVYLIVWVKMFLMAIGVWLEIKSIKTKGVTNE